MGEPPKAALLVLLAAMFVSACEQDFISACGRACAAPDEHGRMASWSKQGGCVCETRDGGR